MDKFTKGHYKEFEKYFEAPEPQGKREFLNKYYKCTGMAAGVCGEEQPYGRYGFLYMLRVQASYISVWLWIFSVLVFIFTYIAGRYIQDMVLWFLFAVIPFIVTFSLSEAMRSVVYGMAEFEMTSRSGLKGVIMSRLVILGTGNLILLFAVAVISGGSTLLNVVYMFVPYLCSATGGLIILRKFPAKEGIYMCCGFCGIISAAGTGTLQSFRWIYGAKYTGIWVIAIIALFIITIYECKRTASMGYTGTAGSNF